MIRISVRGTAAALLVAAPLAAAQHHAPSAPETPAPETTESCPLHGQHTAGLDDRGAAAMGFDQARAEHHFILTPEGGEVRIAAKDPADADTRSRIRSHLREIARLFAAGDFRKPAFIHDRAVPGSATLARLKDRIRYRADETEGGARLVITTTSAEALAALHEFLRFQIADHRTGDPR